MRHFRTFLVVALIAGTAIPAQADDKQAWVGVSTRLKWYWLLKIGDTWDLSIGASQDSTEWVKADEGWGYIELKPKNADDFARLRVYDDYLMARTRGSGKWVEVCRGEWK